VQAKRHRRIREQVQLLNAKLRGYNNYYGVNGNRASLDEFFYHVRRIHQRWLNQRSQRRSYTWAAYTAAVRFSAWLDHVITSLITSPWEMARQARRGGTVPRKGPSHPRIAQSCDGR